MTVGSATDAAGGKLEPDVLPGSQAPFHLPGLDGLRALAVLLVLNGHLTISNPPQLGNWLYPLYVPEESFENFAVDIFFVLSGFLITWLLLGEEKRKGRINLGRFYVRRVFRILPPACAYLAVIGLLNLFGVISLPWWNIGAALVFVTNWLHVGLSDYVGHYWSLGVEEQFYLLWPLLLVSFLSARRFRRGLTILVVAWVAAYISLKVRTATQGGPHAHAVAAVTDVTAYGHWFTAILIGCLLAIARDMPRYHRWLSHWLLQNPIVPYAGLVLGFATAYVHHGDFIAEPVRFILFALVINYLVEGHRTGFDRFLSLAPVEWLGRLSYSVYLWQQLFMWNTTGKPHWYQHFPLSLGLTFTCAIASHYCIEHPFLRLRERLLKKPTAPRPVPVAIEA